MYSILTAYVLSFLCKHSVGASSIHPKIMRSNISGCSTYTLYNELFFIFWDIIQVILSWKGIVLSSNGILLSLGFETEV